MTITTHALTVSDVAAVAGVAPSAVRFYEEHGVIDAVRTSGNQRRFGEIAACRIKVALMAQRVGLTIREIAELLAGLPEEPAPEDWEIVGSALILEAENRVRGLKEALDTLGGGGRLCTAVDRV